MTSRNGWQGYALSLLTGILATALAAWFAWGRDASTHVSTVQAQAIARDVVQTQSPYLEDRPVLRRIEAQVGALNQQMSRMREQLARLEVLLERKEVP